MDSVLSFSTLRSRLLLLVILSLLPAAAAIVDAGFEQRRVATADARENAKRLVRLAAKDHEQFINEGRQLLGTLVQVPQVRDASAGICGEFLARLVAQDERLANIGVIRPDGQVACSGMPLKGRLKVTDRSYFRRAVQTRQFAIGDYQIGRITKLPVIVLAQPAYSAQGRLQSVVFVALNLDRLNRFAARARMAQRRSSRTSRHRWAAEALLRTDIGRSAVGGALEKATPQAPNEPAAPQETSRIRPNAKAHKHAGRFFVALCPCVAMLSDPLLTSGYGTRGGVPKV